MNGDADLPHRSSSPLKRRASSMEPENDHITNGKGGSDSQTSNGFPRAMSVDPPGESQSLGSSGGQVTEPAPSIAEQVKTIETLLGAAKEAPLKVGDKAYLVSRTWVNKALAVRSDNKRAKTDDSDAKSLGPVDNSDIISEVIKDSTGVEFVRLVPGADLEHFELFPEDAWHLVVDWYGIKDGQPPIVRTAINQSPDPQSVPDVIYELNPLFIKVHRLWSEISHLPIEQSMKADKPPPLTLVRSRKSSAHSFLKDIKTLCGVPLDRKIRLHSILPAQPTSDPQLSQNAALTPPDSPKLESNGTDDPWSQLLLDMPTFSQSKDMRQTLDDFPDTTVNPKFNGSSSLQLRGLVMDQTLIVDEAIDNSWVSTYTKSQASKVSKVSRNDASALSSRTNSGRSSPASQGPLTRGRWQRKKPGRSIGAVGLHNLGNTCYMNSALQCVRSVEELTKYFITDSFVDEVNKTNPLGYNGRVALAYVSLLKEIYDDSRSSVSPRDFKTTIGRCRSTFQGWSQQDSQEFLGFLLDGLQEDLSRIKKKPYIEKPDSTDDMINDPEAIRKMAEEVWDITRKRDDSVIADLFTGMYKSTLKCPECDKISITFDPFNNLTLPLPVENMWVRTVKFYPLNDTPVSIEVELPKHSAVEQLKHFVSIRTGVPAERLMGAEEWKDKFFKIYDNQHDVSEEIGSSDTAAIHELEAVPTNWPLKSKPKKRSLLDFDTPADKAEWDDPAYERMVVPVFHRRPQAHGRAESAPPHFITLTKEEASSYEAIQRKVLERLATFSTWSNLHDNDNNMDSDGVVMASDADSSGDSKVAARSVEGEDDMVDITMKNTPDATAREPQQPLPHVPHMLREFNKKRPTFIQPETYLDPSLQNLFDLSYFYSSSEGSVASGWGIDSSTTMPKISDRMPQSPAAEGAENGSPTDESCSSNASNPEESSNEDSTKAEEPSQTRMAEESGDESSGQQFVRRPPPPKFKGKKKFNKGNKTYGKKANKRNEKQMRAQKDAQLAAAAIRPQPMPPAQADGGPLIRLGEGLVLDWNEEAWEQVFEGTSLDDSQGQKTYTNLETLHDSALKISQRRRQTRRSQGITLDECLDEFERAEILSEQDMWYCPRCKEHRRASKKFDLWKSPDILVAHLKRFSSSGFRRDKLDILVDFPIEGLDLTSRVIEKVDGQEEVYDLIGVDDHYGGLGGGHYTAYARNFMDGRWYNYNDSSVSQVSDPSSVVTSAAYLLFYRRRSTKPLGGPRFAEIFAKYEKLGDDGDDSSTEVGDEASDDGFGRTLGSRPALRSQETTTRVRQLKGVDDDDDDDDDDDGLPPSVHPSVEDEGVEMTDSYPYSSSNPVTQTWSFDESGSNALGGSDCASDTVQVSSGDDRGPYDQDVEMNSTADASDNDQQALGSVDRKNGGELISVPAKVENDRDSEEVTEIHLDGDKDTKTE